MEPLTQNNKYNVQTYQAPASKGSHKEKVNINIKKESLNNSQSPPIKQIKINKNRCKSLANINSNLPVKKSQYRPKKSKKNISS